MLLCLLHCIYKFNHLVLPNLLSQNHHAQIQVLLIAISLRFLFANQDMYSLSLSRAYRAVCAPKSQGCLF